MARTLFSNEVLCVFLLLLTATFSHSQTSHSSPASSQLPFSKVLDEDGLYILRWSYNDTHIMFEIQVQTLGYVGFGLSPVGKMNPADIIIAWVNDKQVYLGDYHTKDARFPAMDQEQDWHLMYGYETGNVTTIAVIRRLDTCDVDDVVITSDTMQVIYSFHSDDPDIATGMVPHHGRKRRGSRYILFMSSVVPPQNFPPRDTFMIDVTNAEFPIPRRTLTRICIVYNMTGILTRSHMVKYEPLLTPGNEPFVLRMTLYRCFMKFTKNDKIKDIDGRIYNCKTNAPSVVKTCRSVVATWSKGGEPVYFGKDYGVSLGGPEDPTMYVLELHYSNPQKKPGKLDNSGIRLTYTTTLRQYEAAFLELGNIITRGWRQFVPPNEPDFRSYALCSDRCLTWGFAMTGSPMYAVGVIFHGSEVAASMRLRHLRKDSFNVYELPWIADDKKFNINYQPIRMLEIPITIETGDILSLECIYNTSGRTKPTRGGWSEDKAMCKASLLYYPRKPIDMCLSWTSFDKLKSGLGYSVPESKALTYLSRIKNWENNSIMRRHLRLAIETSTERSLCASQIRKPAYAVDRFQKPTITSLYQKPPTTCNLG